MAALKRCRRPAVNRPWLRLEEFAPLFNVTPDTAKNKIAMETFEIKTYKLGREIVADRAVIDAYFERRRKEGLAALDDSTDG